MLISSCTVEDISCSEKCLTISLEVITPTISPSFSTGRPLISFSIISSAAWGMVASGNMVIGFSVMTTWIGTLSMGLLLHSGAAWLIRLVISYLVTMPTSLPLSITGSLPMEYLNIRFLAL